MKELIFLVEESQEGGYSAKALGEAILTQGDTLDEVRDNVKDAVACHYDENPPVIIRLHIVRDEILSYA